MEHHQFVSEWFWNYFPWLRKIFRSIFNHLIEWSQLSWIPSLISYGNVQSGHSEQIGLQKTVSGEPTSFLYDNFETVGVLAGWRSLEEGFAVLNSDRSPYFRAFTKVCLTCSWYQILTWISQNQNLQIREICVSDGHFDIFPLTHIKLACVKLNLMVLKADTHLLALIC